MIQGRGETWGILRQCGRVAGRGRAPDAARKAALLIAVWVACVCAAGAGNMIVTLKANEKEIEASQVLFENEGLQIVQQPSGAKFKTPFSAVLHIVSKGKDSADEVKRLQEANEKLLKEKVDLEKKYSEARNKLLESQQALNADASLKEEMARAIQAREMEELKKANAALKSDLQGKDDTIASLKKDVEAAQALASPPKPALEITGTSLSTTTLRGVMRVEGEIKNKDQVTYSRVVLEVLVRDSGNKLLGKTHTFVAGLEPGAARTFTADLELDAKEGMATQVIAVTARTKAK